MMLRRISAVRRAMDAKGVSLTDDEALGASCLAYEARHRADEMESYLATFLASLTGGQPARFELPAVKTTSGSLGPIEFDFEVDAPDRGEARTFSLALVKQAKAPPRPSSDSWVQKTSNVLRLAQQSLSQAFGREVDPASLGAAVRPLVADVEAAQGPVAAAVMAVHMTTLLRLMWETSAARTIITSDARLPTGEPTVYRLVASRQDMRQMPLEERDNLQRATLSHEASPEEVARMQEILRMRRVTEISFVMERDPETGEFIQTGISAAGTNEPPSPSPTP